jgi:hypothetical protein
MVDKEAPEPGQESAGAGSAGRLVHEVGYKVKVGLLNVYGPAELDPEHDPVQQLKRDHEREQSGSDTEQREEELRAIREAGQ